MSIKTNAALLAVSFTSLLGSASAATAQAAPTVVVVDVRRITGECTACKAAKTALDAQAQQVAAYRDQLAAPLRTEAAALEAREKTFAGKAPDAAFQQSAQAFQAKQDTANRQLQQRQEGLQRSQQYVLSQIYSKLGPIVTTVMNAHKATLAVEMNSTLASVPAADVTNEVLAQLNTQLPSVSTTAPAAPAAAPGADGR